MSAGKVGRCCISCEGSRYQIGDSIFECFAKFFTALIEMIHGEIWGCL